MVNRVLHFPGRVMPVVVEVDSAVVGDNPSINQMNKKS
jgi:hypothetical protein